MANSFFVGVHTALITAFTVLLKEKVFLPTLVGCSPFLTVTLLCFAWWSVVHSYRQLNSGKFRVVHSLEQMLPIEPYDAEWKALRAEKNRKIYVPLSRIEKWVPICFGVLYALLAATLNCTG